MGGRDVLQYTVKIQNSLITINPVHSHFVVAFFCIFHVFKLSNFKENRNYSSNWLVYVLIFWTKKKKENEKWKINDKSF